MVEVWEEVRIDHTWVIFLHAKTFERSYHLASFGRSDEVAFTVFGTGHGLAFSLHYFVFL